MDEKIKSSFSEYKINYNPASSYLTGGTIQTSIPYAANQANNLSTKVDEMDLSFDSDVETIENSASEWLSSASDFLEQLRNLNNEEINRLQVETDSLEAKYQEYLSNLHLNLEREELIKKLENQLNVLQMNASFSYGLNQEDEISRLTEQISALRKEELEEKMQYIKEHSDEFESFMGMEFEEYNQKIIYNEYTILELKAKDYQLRQQAKELPYEQIKTTEEYISYVSSYTGGSEKSNTYLANRNLESYLSEEQLIMFSYLYDTRGLSEANAYLEAIEDKINQAKGMSEAQVFLSRIIDEEGNVDVGELEYIFTTMGQGLLNGIETFGEGFENLFDITSDGMVTDNQYAQQFILQGLSELQEKGQISKFIDDTYQISTSIGNMLPGSIISILTGGTVGHVLMGMSAAGNAKNEALVSNSDNIALAYLYGAFNGASEAVVGKIMGNIPGLNEGAKFAVKEILSEGAEEFVQTYVDAGLKAVVYHEIPDLGELTEEGLKSFLYGCITSGIMTGGQTAISFTINGVKYSYNNMSELINAYSDGNIVENLESTKNYKLSDRKWSNKYYKELAQSYDDLSFLSQNTGKHLEEIFFDNENVIGIHRCGMMDAERIMDDGLLLTGHLSSGMSQNQSNFKLDRNISFYDKTEMGYLNFIRELKNAGAYKTLDGTGDVIIVSIPKSEIVYDSLGGVTFKNSSSAIDFSGVTPKLSSEYLLGYLNSSPDVLSDIKFRTQIDGDSKEQSSHSLESISEFNNQEINNKTSKLNSISFLDCFIEQLGTGKGRRLLVMYASTGNINHIPVEFRSQMESIPIDDIKTYLNSEKINIGTQYFGESAETTSQIDAGDLKRIDSLNPSNIDEILNDKNFVKKYQREILEKIVQKQDSIFLGPDMYMSINTKVIAHIVDGQKEFYKSLSDDNLIRMLCFDSKNMDIIFEITNRINSGSNIFSRYTLIQKMFGWEFNDSIIAANSLDDTTWNKANELLKEAISYIPEELRNFDYGQYRFGKGLLGKLIKEGRITEQGINIIKELNSKNSNILKHFNFELLDNKSLSKLGAEYIKEVGVYDKLSSKIVALSKNEVLFEAFAKIVNDSKLDDSLSTFYTKTECCLNFLLENIANLSNFDVEILSSDEFINYMLFNKNHALLELKSNRIQLPYTNNYTQEFRSECDRLFKETSNLKKKKDIFYQKFFSLTIDDVKSYLSKYGDDIKTVAKYDENQEVITILELFKRIEETNDVEYLTALYNSQNYFMTSEEMLRFDSSIKKLFSQSYIENLAKTSSNILNGENYTTIDYNGKSVKFVEAGSDFSFIVHSNGTGFKANKTSLVDDSYVTDWYNLSNPRLHGLATSYITETNIGTAPVQDSGVLYGFTNLDVENIAIMAPYDVDSNIGNYGFESGKKQKYISAENMSSHTFRVYNEIVLDRSSVTPDCVIIYDDSSQQMINNAFKAASDWVIPVVRINKLQLAKEQASKIDYHIDEFKKTGNIQSLNEAINLYESNISGYKLNAHVKEGQIDATSSINNDIVANIFSPQKIEISIIEFLNSTTSIEEIDSVIRVLEDIKYKYDVVNKNGTGLVANTQPGINIEYLIDYSKQRKGSIYD